MRLAGRSNGDAALTERAVDDLVRSLAWKDALWPDTSHTQTSDLGHEEQGKTVLRCGEESLNSTTPDETRSVGA